MVYKIYIVKLKNDEYNLFKFINFFLIFINDYKFTKFDMMMHS